MALSSLSENKTLRSEFGSNTSQTPFLVCDTKIISNKKSIIYSYFSKPKKIVTENSVVMLICEMLQIYPLNVSKGELSLRKDL